MRANFEKRRKKLIKSDWLCADRIRAYLTKPETARDIVIYDTIASTNQAAKQHAAGGAKHGTVILSEEQTEGRGRFGRSFFSPAMHGIYMSIVLRSDLPAAGPSFITAAAAVASANAIESVTGADVKIKWINDLLVRGKKVGGILAETVAGSKSEACMVLGIGINFSMPKDGFPPALNETAGALFDQKPEGISRNRLAAALIDSIRHMGSRPDPGDYLPEYKQRSAVLHKRVRITGPAAITGRAVDIDPNGNLVVVSDAGETLTLNAGEVSIRGWDR